MRELNDDHADIKLDADDADIENEEEEEEENKNKRVGGWMQRIIYKQ